MLPTLYARNVDGSIQIWEVEVSSNAFRTIYGRKDGAVTYSEWTVCEGKNVGRANETSPEEQAYLEAKSKWQAKKDKKFFERIEDIDKVVYQKPMLAHKWQDYASKTKWPLYSSPKLDGNRMIVDGERLYSRNGKAFLSVPHIQTALASFLAVHPDIILDGELYNHELKDDFNQICSLTRKSKPTQNDLKDSERVIQYHVYDIIHPEWTYEERLSFLRSYLPVHPSIKLVAAEKVYNLNELNEKYKLYLSQGYEGQMVRVPNSVYQNKRSKFLLKRKEFLDSEFQIVDIVEGVGGRAGMAGAVTLTKDGKIFNAGIAGGFGYYSELWNNRESLIGQIATVQYFELTPDGIPRFPVLKSVRNYE